MLPYIVKSYFIEVAYSNEEFIRLQVRLFNKGYKWIDGEKIFDLNFPVVYPIYVSNLPFTESSLSKRFENIRYNYDEYFNNIFFFDSNKNVFNLKLLRREKLKKLNSM